MIKTSYLTAYWNPCPCFSVFKEIHMHTFNPVTSNRLADHASPVSNGAVGPGRVTVEIGVLTSLDLCVSSRLQQRPTTGSPEQKPLHIDLSEKLSKRNRNYRTRIYLLSKQTYYSPQHLKVERSRERFDVKSWPVKLSHVDKPSPSPAREPVTLDLCACGVRSEVGLGLFWGDWKMKMMIKHIHE